MTVSRIAEPRTIRLVATARLRDPVLRRLAANEQEMADLAEIEGATSGRLTAQDRGADALDPREFVAGVPHAHFINAAFSYWRPRELNRFNGPGRGAWYACFDIETCIAEISFHMTRELERIDDFHATVDYAVLYASFAGDFLDLRGDEALDCLHPDPSIAYPHGNLIAEDARNRGLNGIIYPSVRHVGGTCLVALRPQAVQSAAQGSIYRLEWQGSKTPAITEMSS